MQGRSTNRWDIFPCFAVVIAHGQTEYTLADFLRRRYNLHMHVLGHKHGRSSIQVSGLSNWIVNHSNVRNRKCTDSYCGFTRKQQWNNLYIYTIMDIGNVSDKNIKNNYIHGHITPRIPDDTVRNHIKTIYNYRDIEDTFTYAKMRDINRDDKSRTHYRKVFSRQLGTIRQVKDFYKKIKNDRNTNMDEFIKACIDNMSDFTK